MLTVLSLYLKPSWKRLCLNFKIHTKLLSINLLPSSLVNAPFTFFPLIQNVSGQDTSKIVDISFNYVAAKLNNIVFYLYPKY